MVKHKSQTTIMQKKKFKKCLTNIVENEKNLQTNKVVLSTIFLVWANSMVPTLNILNVSKDPYCFEGGMGKT